MNALHNPLQPADQSSDHEQPFAWGNDFLAQPGYNEVLTSSPAATRSEHGKQQEVDQRSTHEPLIWEIAARMITNPAFSLADPQTQMRILWVVADIEKLDVTALHKIITRMQKWLERG